MRRSGHVLVHPSLDQRSCRHDALDVVLQFRIIEPDREVSQRTAFVGRNNIEEARDRGRKAADHEITVEKNRRDVGAREEVREVAVRAVEILHLGQQFLIDGLQLLVQRLQFLFCGFELFIARLKLFVE